MKHHPLATAGLTALTLAMILMAAPVLAQTEMPVNYQWSAPTTGTPVDHYVVERSVNGGTWTQIATASSNSYTLTADVGEAHQIRVAGVDVDGRQGVYSVASDPYVPDAGPPGQPGKPIVF